MEGPGRARNLRTVELRPPARLHRCGPRTPTPCASAGNYWDGTQTSMRSLGSSGVWEIFVPEVGVGARYKFEIRAPAAAGSRAIPAGPRHQLPRPRHRSSPFTSTSGPTRSGAGTCDRNTSTTAMSIYEVHAGSWRQGLGASWPTSWSPYVKQMGFTHVRFMPGRAPLRRLVGSGDLLLRAHLTLRHPGRLRYLVDAHRRGRGVILDQVPRTSPRTTSRWLASTAPRCTRIGPARRAPDWGTVFNFGRREVRNLVITLCTGSRDFHIDGLRVDARGLDAVPGLLAQGWPVASQPVWWPREPGRSSSSGSQRDRVPSSPRHRMIAGSPRRGPA